MGKINTPLMQSIERKEKRIIELKEQYSDLEMNHPKPVDRMQQVLARIGELTMMIVDDKKCLPTERDMIEKVHNDSIVDFISELGMNTETEPQRAKDYFTQTFKSYE